MSNIAKVKDLPPRDQYVASGGQTVFTYTFPIFDEGDIAVEKNSVLLTITADYTVTGVGAEDGGTIVLTSGATAGDIITIYRDMALDRLIDYQQNGDFLADNVNRDYDRLWLAIQQVVGGVGGGASLGRAWRASPGDSLTASEMVIAPESTRNNTVVGFDSNGKFTYSPPVFSKFDGKQFDNLSACLLDTTLSPGQTIVVLGRNFADDGGGNVYKFRSPSAQTADGGKWIDHANSNGQLEGTFPDGNVNVKQFGAVGDGVSDDTTAIQSALDYVDAKLFFPAGVYRHTAQFSVSGKAITLQGSGASGTIIFSDSTNCISIDNTSLPDREQCGIFDIGFETDENGVYKAVDFSGSLTSALGFGITIKNCSFTGRVNQSAWNVAIDIFDGSFSEIENCFFRGNTANRNAMTSAVIIDTSTDCKLLNNFYYWANVAVNITGFSEGITIRDSHFVPVNVGVRHRGTGNLVWVEDCHISAYVAAIQIGQTAVNGVNHCHINSNLIFKNEFSSDNFTAIDLASDKHEVSGNEILIPGGSAAGGSQNGIVVRSGTELCRVSGNQVANMDTGILCETGALFNLIHGNTFLNCTADIIDNTLRSFIHDNQTSNRSKSSLVSMSGNQTVSDSTSTIVSWGTEDRDYMGLFDIASPTRLTVPAKTRQVVVSAGIQWGINSTGERYVEILHNGGASLQGLSASRNDAVASSDCAISTAIVDVNPGDFFEVRVRQTSGGNLDVVDNARTWFSMQII